MAALTDPTQVVIGRAVDTRLALEMARRRARMYLADPSSDPAVSAESCLSEVLGILEGAPVGDA